jgi:hypothetical protein
MPTPSLTHFGQVLIDYRRIISRNFAFLGFPRREVRFLFSRRFSL